MPSDAIRAALIRRLRISSGISEDDVKEVEALPIVVRQFPAETPVVRDGERATDCCLIADGFCVRSKTIASGKRQIRRIRSSSHCSRRRKQHGKHEWNHHADGH